MPSPNDSLLDVYEYERRDGTIPFQQWLDTFDTSLRIRISSYVSRLADGNISAVKSIGDGVSELRIDSGPGYRIYFARVGSRIIVLLAGGTKRRQQADIERAKSYLQDYIQRHRGIHASIPSIPRNDS